VVLKFEACGRLLDALTKPNAGQPGSSGHQLALAFRLLQPRKARSLGSRRLFKDEEGPGVDDFPFIPSSRLLTFLVALGNAPLPIIRSGSFVNIFNHLLPQFFSFTPTR